MQYSNKEMKIDQFVGYINAGKINLIPSFQRGQVWTPILRRRLIENMIHGRPIPAVFLYKEESGSTYEYNILDGKQRLESLMLFIGTKNSAFSIKELSKYFFAKSLRNQRNFKVDVDGQKQGFSELSEAYGRNFREYAIPTIEISLENSSFREIVDLFVDINTYGVKVSRFDVVKAVVADPLLGSVLDLIAMKQVRGKTVHYKAKATVFTQVLGRQDIIARIPVGNARVDRMWERLAEFALYTRTGRHRAPVAILRAFIKGGEQFAALSAAEGRTLRKTFVAIQKAYQAAPALSKSRLATDQPQFYTMVTSLITSDLLATLSQDELTRRLNLFAQIIDGKAPAPAGVKLDAYQDLTARQTTNVGRRDERGKLFVNAIKALEPTL